MARTAAHQLLRWPRADNYCVAVMSPGGGELRHLIDIWRDEAPSWSPNGRIIQFFWTERNSGKVSIWQVDFTGRNECACPRRPCFRSGLEAASAVSGQAKPSALGKPAPLFRVNELSGNDGYAFDTGAGRTILLLFLVAGTFTRLLMPVFDSDRASSHKCGLGIRP